MATRHDERLGRDEAFDAVLAEHSREFELWMTELTALDLADHEPVMLPPRLDGAVDDPNDGGLTAARVRETAGRKSRPDLASDALMRLSIRDLGRLLRTREVCALEIARASLDAINANQASINAFITVTGDCALRQAQAVDAELARGSDRGPLMGIPVAVKDVFETEGVRTTAASSVLADWVPKRDATVVTRLRGAGAIMMGKLNMDEFAYGPHQAAFGRTNNPHDLTRYTGGSSGGSAAAVASNSIWASVGTDAGGSIRIPAAWCGVVGLKPTYGRVSLSGALRTAWSLEHAGPMARSVADTRTMFHALAVPPARPGEVPTAPPRLALVSGSLDGVSPRVSRAMQTALARIAAAGATPLPEREIQGIEHSHAAFMVTLASEGALGLEPILRTSADAIAPKIRATFTIGSSLRACDYVRAQRFRGMLYDSVDAALRGIDALLTPTMATVATKWADIADRTQSHPSHYLSPFDLTGHPAVTIPAPTQGLPVGVQLIGHIGDDERLLDVAEWVERQFRGETE
jgi:aspartyl-tRNA(Asn)/glutamyl-tRNA(Gln) amidotransferase subunit A